MSKTYTITCTDGSGAAVASQPVTFAINPSGIGTLGATTGTTNGSGQATVTVTKVGPTGTAKVTMTPDNFPSTAVTAFYMESANGLVIKPSAPARQASDPLAVGVVYNAVMAEGSGTALSDKSTNADNGTLPTSAMWNASGMFSGPCLNINNDASRLVVLPSPTSFQQLGDMTVVIPVSLVANNTGQCFVSCFGADAVSGLAYGWAVGLDDGATGKAKFFTCSNDAAGHTTLSPAAITTGAFQFLIFTLKRSTGTKKIYNGATLLATDTGAMMPTYSPTNPASPAPFYACLGGLRTVGPTAANVQPTNGFIDTALILNYEVPLAANAAAGWTKYTIEQLVQDMYLHVRP